ncbi:copia protein [Tanacetum coccineum]|uniref:Copia protein n=1 Tax=Tanacetum coccineum TaxID=301880 RepID=A0ABQ5D6E9_9ASTR
MTIIGTKWVFRNKLDENGIVSQNKARLVAQGYNQQEGIDYDETYAPVARLESIRILLAYACALDFKLFQMDVKSAFLNGFINKEDRHRNCSILPTLDLAGRYGGQKGALSDRGAMMVYLWIVIVNPWLRFFIYIGSLMMVPLLVCGFAATVKTFLGSLLWKLAMKAIGRCY